MYQPCVLLFSVLLVLLLVLLRFCLQLVGVCSQVLFTLGRRFSDFFPPVCTHHILAVVMAVFD